MTGGPEILGSGSEADWDREPLGARVLGRLRRRPRVFLALVVACALVAALGVGAVGWYGVRYLTGPELPDLTSARAIEERDEAPDPGWQAGDDGRPSSPACQPGSGASSRSSIARAEVRSGSSGPVR